MMSKFQLLELISPGSLDALITTLCDGEALKKLGITDEDTSTVEDLYEWALVPEEKLSDFAEGCYDFSSISELIEALIIGPTDGETDMELWDLTPSDWTSDIESALREILRYYN